MPELPEVEALATFLDARTRGARVADVTLASLSALKTVSPSLTDLVGQVVAGCERRGKFLVLRTVEDRRWSGICPSVAGSSGGRTRRQARSVRARVRWRCA